VVVRIKLESLQAMDITIRLGQVDIEPVNCVRDLSVLLDSSLSMHQHIESDINLSLSSPAAPQA